MWRAIWPFFSPLEWERQRCTIFTTTTIILSHSPGRCFHASKYTDSPRNEIKSSYSPVMAWPPSSPVGWIGWCIRWPGKCFHIYLLYTRVLYKYTYYFLPLTKHLSPLLYLLERGKNRETSIFFSSSSFIQRDHDDEAIQYVRMSRRSSLATAFSYYFM